MKKTFLISFIILCILTLPISVYANSKGYTFEYNKEEQVLQNSMQIGCQAAFVAEPTTGKIIYEKNAHERMYPASTTKILTALLVLENCDLNDRAVVSQNAIDLIPDGYATAELKAGEELRVVELLKALLIPSANEAANVLAEHVSGSIEAFADLCNKRAKELGCEDLHFVNPNGIHDEDHYCTAYDLYLIAKECQKHDIFNEIVKTKWFTLPATDVFPYDDRTFSNTNELLNEASSEYFYPYCTGIKTGFTTPAGDCLVASSTNNNIDLISVVLGGEISSEGLIDRFYDTIKLFNFVYDNYSYKKIAEKNEVITTVTVDKATKNTALLDIIIDNDIYSIVPNFKEVEMTFKLTDKIEAPIEQNQVMGTATFKIDGLNYTTEIMASHAVQKIPFWLINCIIASVALIVLIVMIIIIVKIVRKHKNNHIEIYYNEPISHIYETKTSIESEPEQIPEPNIEQKSEQEQEAESEQDND